MAVEVIMPKAGMSMEEGTIVKWFKKEGDKVEKGETLLEILTDKVNMEVEAPEDGILIKILASEGDVVPVVTTIAYIGEIGEKIEQSNEKIVKEEIKEQEKIEDIRQDKIEIIADNGGKIRATPAARKLSRVNKIQLSKIYGSGPNGRIQKKDVEEFKLDEKKISSLAKKIAEGNKVDLEAISGSGIRGKVMKVDVLAAIGNTGKTIIPLSQMRKIIGKRMTESFFTAPTFTLNTEVDMSKTINLRKELVDLIKEETGLKITFTDFIVKASAKALKKFPLVNASLVEDGILLHDEVNIGLAVGLDEGLIVPVIKNADKMSFNELVIKSKDLVLKATNKKLLPSDMEESTFSISNLGMYGITHFNPIINQPNSAILGVSAITEKLVMENGQVVSKPMMFISLTIDHRVIDGAPGAKFLKYIKELLENPMKLFV